ncbi:MAG: adenine phosphoribosyltransferase [Candidatus Margulisiibacteriota bacterium]|jgi:adenine phosphoribosyltransferase
MDLRSAIRTVPNWPKPGIMFRDITTLISDPKSFQNSIDQLYDRYKDQKIDKVLGIESRGFIFGAVLAYKLGVGFIVVRKPGKLPYKTISQEYALEYGTDKIEIHEDAITKGDKVLIVDDLIATGGTVQAAAKLVEKLGGEVVELAFVVGLPEILDKTKISKYKMFTLVDFEGE